MSVESFLFAVVLLVALMVLPNAQPESGLPDEVAPAVVMELLSGSDYRRDGLRK